MKAIFLRFKNKFINQNLFLSLQLLFTWSFYKILGFLGFSIFFRLCVMPILFICLFFSWVYLIRFIMNNFLFQLCIFLVLHFINLLIRSNSLTFLLALSFSFGYCVIGNPGTIIIIKEIPVIFAYADLLFFFLFLLGFVKKLCDVAFYQQMGKEFSICIFSPKEFNWLYILGLLNSFLAPHIVLENKLPFQIFEKFPYLYYPFSYTFLQELSKPENNWATFFRSIGKLFVENLEEANAFHEFSLHRCKQLSKYRDEHEERNNHFYKLIWLGFVLGFVFATLYLNGCFH